jgi:hypothetical protein
MKTEFARPRRPHSDYKGGGRGGTTRDDADRRCYGPDDPRPWFDYLRPGRRGKWWNFYEGETRDAEYLYNRMPGRTVAQATNTLAEIEAVAASATERAAVADRRASTIAGTVAISSSFTLSGAAFVLDPARVDQGINRLPFAIILVLTTVAFVFAAFYALMALVGARRWNWTQPPDVAWSLPDDDEQAKIKQLHHRAAHLLADFAGNWEIADVKTRHVAAALSGCSSA